jgi:hypothetical protein
MIPTHLASVITHHASVEIGSQGIAPPDSGRDFAPMRMHLVRQVVRHGKRKGPDCSEPLRYLYSAIRFQTL